MIICHRRKFIFLKTRKTAGTSIEIALSRLCGPGDVVTALTPEDEDLRREEGGWQGRDVPKSRTNLDMRDAFGLLRGKGWPHLFYNHVPARAVHDALPRGIWDSYLKISVERNPWDRVLSQYWWDRRGREDYPSISDRLRKRARRGRHKLSNWDIYAIGDRLVADRVLFYENLEADLAGLGQALGVPDLRLPHARAKGNRRADTRHYRELLSREDAALIARVCRKEIDAFGYEY